MKKKERESREYCAKFEGVYHSTTSCKSSKTIHLSLDFGSEESKLHREVMMV